MQAPEIGGVVPPPLQVTARQQQQHWSLTVESTASHLQADYERGDGQWSVSGNGALNEWLADGKGRWRLDGEGVWQGQPAGTLSATLEDAGLQSQPQKADLAMKARFTGAQWQAEMRLTEPLAVHGQWQLAIPEPLSCKGRALLCGKPGGSCNCKDRQDRFRCSLAVTRTPWSRALAGSCWRGQSWMARWISSGRIDG